MKKNILVLADSLAPFLPPNFRITAYRGAHFEDLNTILERDPIPDQIQVLLLLIGLNDRNGDEGTLPNIIIRLTQLLRICHHSRRFLIFTIPHLVSQPLITYYGANMVNDFITDIFQDSSSLIKLPSDFEAVCFRPNDFSHYDSSTAQAFSAHIIQAVNHLN